MTTEDKKKYGGYVDVAVKAAVAGLVSLVFGMQIGMNKDITEIKIRQAEGAERGRQRAEAIADLKNEVRSLRADLAIMSSRVLILETKESDKVK